MMRKITLTIATILCLTLFSQLSVGTSQLEGVGDPDLSDAMEETIPGEMDYPLFPTKYSDIDIAGDDLGQETGDNIRSFVENKGQISDPSVLFYTDGGTNRVGLKNDGIIYSIRGQDQSFVYRMELIGCTPTIPQGISDTGQRSNFFLGNIASKWITDVNHYGELIYENIYPDIDLRFYITSSTLKYDLVVNPGGSVEDINLKYHGVSPELRGEELVIRTPVGNVIEDSPLSFTDSNPIGSSWNILQDGTVTFQVDNYDREETLTIDPAVYFSTYLGGNSYESDVDSRISSDGYIYISGYTSSTDFPTSLGCYDNEAEGSDAFLAKIDRMGGRFIFSTRIGGAGGDYGRSLQLDDDGNIFVCGQTNSADFPTTDGAFQEEHQGLWDVFVLKMNKDGDRLIHSTYIGAYSIYDSEQEVGGMVDIDDKGFVYVGGSTGSPNFPFTDDAYSNQTYGLRDIFVMKLNISFDKVIYCTSVGGNGNDYMYYMEVLEDESVIFGGNVYSTNYPTTSGAYDRTHNGGRDAFLTILNRTGESLVSSTYLGGSGGDSSNGFSMNEAGDIFITGTTESTNFPITGNAHDKTLSGTDAYVTVLNKSFAWLDYSTYLGGGANDGGWDIVHYKGDEAFAVGYTNSQNMIVKESWFNDALNGPSDGYLVRLNTSNGSVVQSSLLGGSGGDSIIDIHMDDNRSFMSIAGSSSSTDFPITSNNVDNTLSDPERGDIFIMKLLVDDLIAEPGNFTMVSGDRFLDLSWEPPAVFFDEPFTSYSFYMGPSRDNLSYQFDLSTDLTHLNLTGLTNGKEYFVTLAGNTRFGEGPRINITGGIPSTIPETPRNLTLSLQRYHVDLSWDEPASDGGAPITEYLIYRYRGTDEFSLIGNTTDLSWRDDLVENGSSYGYRISALNLRGEGNSSNEEDLLMGFVPTEPRNLSVSTSGPMEISLEWEVPENDFNLSISEYMIYRANATGPFFPVARTSNTEYVDLMLEEGVDYRYKISAVNIMGEGPGSKRNGSRAIDLPGIVTRLDVVEGDGEVELEWNAPLTSGGGEIGYYELYRGTGGSPLVLLNKTTELSYVDHDVNNGISYSYRIEAYNEVGAGNGTLTVHASPFTTPNVPLGLEGSRADGTFSVTWRPPACDGGREVDQYVVYYSPLEDYRKEFVTVTTTHAEIGDITPGTTYEIYVIALNERGYGPPSPTVEMKAITTPEAPASIYVVSAGDENVTISWFEPPFDGGLDITNYRILRDGEEIAKVDNMTLQFTDEGLTNGVKYTYRVMACNDLGPSEVSVSAEATPTSIPGSPQDLKVSRNRNGLEIEWSIPTETGGMKILNYIVYRGRIDGTPTIIKETPDRRFIDRKMEHGVDHVYSVVAVNIRGEGAPSEQVIGNYRTVPGQALGLNSSMEGDDVILTWSYSGEDVLGFRVYRKDVSGKEALIGETGPGEVEFIDVQTTAGAEYQYVVLAFNSYGEGLRSEPAQVEIEKKVVTNSSSTPTIISAIIGILIIIILCVLLVIIRSSRHTSDTMEDAHINEPSEQMEVQEDPPAMSSESTEPIEAQVEPPKLDPAPTEEPAVQEQPTVEQEPPQEPVIQEQQEPPQEPVVQEQSDPEGPATISASQKEVVS